MDLLLVNLCPIPWSKMHDRAMVNDVFGYYVNTSFLNPIMFRHLHMTSIILRNEHICILTLLIIIDSIILIWVYANSFHSEGVMHIIIHFRIYLACWSMYWTFSAYCFYGLHRNDRTLICLPEMEWWWTSGIKLDIPPMLFCFFLVLIANLCWRKKY